MPRESHWGEVAVPILHAGNQYPLAVPDAQNRQLVSGCQIDVDALPVFAGLLLLHYSPVECGRHP